MKDTIANKIASFIATLDVADKSEFKAVWENQPPLAFTGGIAAVRPMVAALSDKAAKQSADITGSAKQLRQLRKQFETQLHALPRATYQCLAKQGQTATAEKANLTPSDLHDARGVALAGIGSTVLDAAEPLLALSSADHHPPPRNTLPRRVRCRRRPLATIQHRRGRSCERPLQSQSAHRPAPRRRPRRRSAILIVRRFPAAICARERYRPSIQRRLVRRPSGYRSRPPRRETESTPAAKPMIAFGFNEVSILPA